MWNDKDCEELADAFKEEDDKGTFWACRGVPLDLPQYGPHDLCFDEKGRQFYKKEDGKWVRLTINNANKAQALLLRKYALGVSRNKR